MRHEMLAYLTIPIDSRHKQQAGVFERVGSEHNYTRLEFPNSTISIEVRHANHPSMCRIAIDLKYAGERANLQVAGS